MQNHRSSINPNQPKGSTENSSCSSIQLSGRIVQALQPLITTREEAIAILEMDIRTRGEKLNISTADMLLLGLLTLFYYGKTKKIHIFPFQRDFLMLFYMCKAVSNKTTKKVFTQLQEQPTAYKNSLQVLPRMLVTCAINIQPSAILELQSISIWLTTQSLSCSCYSVKCITSFSRGL